jgi:hypothetical protein
MTTIDPDRPMAAADAAAPDPDRLTAAAEAAGPDEIGRRSTSAALGTPLIAWNRLILGGGARRWGDVALGAAFQAEETTVALLADLRRTGAWRRRIAGLAERGAAERARGRLRAVVAVEGAATAVATSAIVDRVVDAQLERLLRPIVLAVLDEVLGLLEQEPERIQALMRGQRDSMVDELITRIRAGAATGDTAVDRLTSRVFHRDRRPAPRRAATDEL